MQLPYLTLYYAGVEISLHYYYSSSKSPQCTPLGCSLTSLPCDTACFLHEGMFLFTYPAPLLISLLHVLQQRPPYEDEIQVFDGTSRFSATISPIETGQRSRGKSRLARKQITTAGSLDSVSEIQPVERENLCQIP